MRRDALPARQQDLFGHLTMGGAATLNAWLRAAVLPTALLALLITLADCGAVPLLDSAQLAAAPPQYGTIAAAALRNFKNYTSYSDFEISAPRWVHATTGWNWLVCVRYSDGGRQRFYSFFIDNNSVVNQRYDIVTDQCGLQQYVPLDVTTGTIGAPTPMPQQPIY